MAKRRKRASSRDSGRGKKGGIHAFIPMFLRDVRPTAKKTTGTTSSGNAVKEASDEVAHKLLRYLRRSNRAYQRAVGNVTPQSLNDFYPHLPIDTAKAPRDEIRWTHNVILQHTEVINQFLTQADDFAENVLSGDLAGAEDCYNSINASVGFSLWSIEQGLLLAELKGGIEENRTFFSGLRRETDDIFAQLLAQFASVRAETAPTYSAYRSIVEEELRPLDLATEIRDYLEFKAFPGSFKKYPEESLTYFLGLESSYAIIDRYLLLVSLLQEELIAPRLEHSSTPFYTIARLAERISDPRLRGMLSYITCARLTSTASLERDIERLTELYTAGDYGRVRTESVQALREHSSCLELYELYVKSSIWLTADPASPFPPNAPGTSLLESMNGAMRRFPTAFDCIDRLEKLASLLRWHPLGGQLLGFCARLTWDKGHINAERLREINCAVITPRFSTAFSETSDKLSFLSTFANSDPPFRRTVEAFRAEAGDSDVEVADNLPSHRRDRLLAERLLAEGKADEAIQTLTHLSASFLDNPLVQSDTLATMISALLSKGDIAQCGRLYATHYLRRPELVLHISLPLILSEFENKGGEYFDPSVIWPTLYHVNYVESDLPLDIGRLYRLLKRCLSAAQCSRPSLLDIPTDPEWAPIWIYFWNEVCITEVIDSLGSIDTTEGVEEERMAILGRLIDVHPSGAEIYQEEISKIAQARSIRAALLTLDSSRVFVDIRGIRRSLDRGFADMFQRYRRLHGLDVRIREQIYDVQIVEGKRVQAKETSVDIDAVVQMFFGLFFDLRDRYLTSTEYGLDSFLSIRIRHGSLVGQLRAPFERYHLITTRDLGTKKYEDNEYVLRDFATRGEKAVRAVSAALNRFSKSVDELIEEVKNDWIQIKSPASPKGLFDFEFSEVELASHYAQFATVEDLDLLVEELVQVLNARTESCLQRIREALMETLRTDLMEELDRLEMTVTAIDPGAASSALRDSIAQCRPALQAEVESVAGWFEGVGDAPVEEFDISTLVETAIDVVRRSHVSRPFNPEIRIGSKARIDGAAFNPLVNVLLNVLENAILRGAGDGWVAITVDDDGSRVSLAVRNRYIRSDVTIDELKDRLAAGAASSAVRREGNSGYYKIGRLIGVDLLPYRPELDPLMDTSSRTFKVTLSLCPTRQP